MIPGVTAARLSGARHRAELPLLVLGPSLGTSAQTLWAACAAGLSDAFDVLAWDLPGHGYNRTVPDDPFTMAELAAGVLRVVDDVLAERGEVKGPFFYAGNSVGGCVGLQLMLDAPARVTAAALLCTGARIGSPDLWADRIGELGVSGTDGLVTASAERWFGPGFPAREPARASALLQALRATDDEGYLRACAALGEFDVRDRLAEIGVPVLAVAGAVDGVTPTVLLGEIADGVQDGRLAVLDAVAHLAPAEVPHTVARLLREHLLGEPPEPEGSVGFTDDLRTLLEELAAGHADDRPGLDPRSRALVTLTASVARGRRDDLADHLRTARRHGVTAEEIRELLLQTAVYSGLPDATAAYRIAQQVLDEPDQP